MLIHLFNILATKRRSVATPWYLSGGIAAGDCVAAYAPKGAASLAASYINLANPGTYDAAPGVAPTFDAATGWTFNGSSQWLNSGVTPNDGMSLIIRFSDVAYVNANAWIMGAFTTSPENRVTGVGPVFQSTTANYCVGLLIYNTFRSPIMSSGTMGISGVTPFRNGAADGANLTASTPSATNVIGIGCLAQNGAYSRGTSGKVQGVALYTVSISPAQMLAVHNAMSAL